MGASSFFMQLCAYHIMVLCNICKGFDAPHILVCTFPTKLSSRRIGLHRHRSISHTTRTSGNLLYCTFAPPFWWFFTRIPKVGYPYHKDPESGVAIPQGSRKRGSHTTRIPKIHVQNTRIAKGGILPPPMSTLSLKKKNSKNLWKSL